MLKSGDMLFEKNICHEDFFSELTAHFKALKRLLCFKVLCFNQLLQNL